MNDVYPITQDYIQLTELETSVVSALFMVLLLCIVVRTICDIIEPEHSAYRASMAVQMEEHISELNRGHPGNQIELRRR